jgi:hypothetical protein
MTTGSLSAAAERRRLPLSRLPLRSEDAVTVAFIGSRILIWVVGCAGVLVLGTATGAVHAFDPHGASSSLGSVGNVLAAPAVRWDSIWYLMIAKHGYVSAQETAFYPLYPLLVHLASFFTGSLAAAGIAISLASLLGALILLHRLTELELGARTARGAVLLVALGPMAVFLSAVYTESLFLLLSAGTIYAARRGQWALAGAVGGLAALTRVEGVLLAVPVVLLFLYGPREGEQRLVSAPRWRPRYRFTPAIGWTALIPAAAGCWPLYLTVRGFGPDATAHAEAQFWHRHLAVPVIAVWDGIVAAWHELMQALTSVGASAFTGQELLQVGFLVLSTAALVGVFRRLPIAYGAYAALALIVPLAAPDVGDPLKDFDRYASVVFPLFMWAADWALRRGALRALLITSTVALVFCTVQFATWHWVGSRMV